MGSILLLLLLPLPLPAGFLCTLETRTGVGTTSHAGVGEWVRMGKGTAVCALSVGSTTN